MIRAAIACLLLLLPLAAAEPGKVEIDAMAPWISQRGWTPVRLTIAAGTDARVEITASCRGSSATLAVALAAGERVQRWVLIPDGPDQYDVQIRLRWLNPDGTPGDAYAQAALPERSTIVLVDPDAEPRTGQLVAVQSAVGRLPETGYRRGNDDAPAAVLAASDLPPSWQGYPPHVALWFGRGAEARLDAAQRLAVQRFCADGGLVAFGDPAIAAAWTAGACRPIAADAAAVSRLSSAARQPQEASGSAEVEEQQRIAADIAADRRLIGETFIQAHQRLLARWQAGQGLESARPGYVVPGTAQVGGWAFAIIAILFALIAGPGLLWWTSRRGRPLLLVVLIPAAGAIACLALLAWDLVALGWNRQRSLVEVTAIDAVRAEHRSMQGQALFGAFGRNALPAGEDEQWTVRHDADRQPTGRRRWRHDDAEADVALVLGRGQLSGQILVGRSTGHLSRTAIVPDRRRIAIRRQGDGYAVANGLGAGVVRFAWRDAAGDPWHLDAPLADGAVAPLLPGAASIPPPPVQRLPASAAAAWNAALERPGAWRATLDRPLHPPAAPPAVDAEPAKAWACGEAEPAAGGGSP